MVLLVYYTVYKVATDYTPFWLYNILPLMSTEYYVPIYDL